MPDDSLYFHKESQSMSFDPVKLDDIGRRMVKELQENARISFADLGRRVGLTPAGAAERVRKLEDTGIITGYHAEINLEKLGLPITAQIGITASSNIRHKVKSTVEKIPEITECYHATGSDCFLVRVGARSISHLEEIIEKLNPLGQLTTSIFLSSVLEKRITMDAVVN